MSENSNAAFVAGIYIEQLMSQIGVEVKND